MIPEASTNEALEVSPKAVCDDYLKLVIQHLADHWMDPEVGIVAAGIFDPKYPPVIATSELRGEGKWIHAERNALEQFESQYGEPGPETIVVITLSPCIKPMPKSRVSSSCTELLLKRGLKRVHAGVIDSLQVNEGIQDYKNLGLDITIPEHNSCKSVCENLPSIFQTYGDRVNHDLNNIKKEITDSVFSR